MISIQVDVCFTRESVPKPENQSFVFSFKNKTDNNSSKSKYTKGSTAIYQGK
jgi:uncharacterized protein affecting Mg2+/Co2+ transport